MISKVVRMVLGMGYYFGEEIINKLMQSKPQKQSKQQQWQNTRIYEVSNDTSPSNKVSYH